MDSGHPTVEVFVPLRCSLLPNGTAVSSPTVVLCLAILVALLAMASRTASAQTASVSGPPMQVDAQLRARLVAAMERDLKTLVAAQQSYLAARKEFASSFERGAIKGVKLSPSPGVTVTLTYVTKQTFAARATHDWLPGRSCVLKVGSVATSRTPTTTNEKKLPTRDGVPTCDSK